MHKWRVYKTCEVYTIFEIIFTQIWGVTKYQVSVTAKPWCWDEFFFARAGGLIIQPTCDLWLMICEVFSVILEVLNPIKTKMENSVTGQEFKTWGKQGMA